MFNEEKSHLTSLKTFSHLLTLRRCPFLFVSVILKCLLPWAFEN